ncbi:putative F-box protein At1g47790 [Apium graveolens]|uniref:putative F-box protein At1g47790 n=1 Tax=Apium graveolens TaxID=4045 RepID=UPI003D7A0F44
MARRRRYCSYLPEEIMFEILSWLPVKSLVRFKSVCKLWRSIISNNIFIRTHLANSKNKGVILNYRSDLTEIAGIADYDYIEVHDTHQDSVKLYHLPPRETSIIYINSFDGLVCLYNYDGGVIYIWNPATRRFKILPSPNKEFSNVRAFVGLGFDPICNDYKILRIVFRRLVSSFGQRLLQAELYSANADSWKEIPISESLREFHPFSTKIVHAKTGVLYLESHTELLAFDLHREVFQLYPLPKLCHIVRSQVLDYEGNVTMIFESIDKSVSLYMLDDAMSWTKMFSFEDDLKLIWVGHYLGNGHFVANTYRTYDHKIRETKLNLLQFPIDGMKGPVKYSESLVSLDGFQEQDLRGAQFDIDLSPRRKEVLDVVEEYVKKKITGDCGYKDVRALRMVREYLYGTCPLSLLQ